MLARGRTLRDRLGCIFGLRLRFFVFALRSMVERRPAPVSIDRFKDRIIFAAAASVGTEPVATAAAGMAAAMRERNERRFVIVLSVALSMISPCFGSGSSWCLLTSAARLGLVVIAARPVAATKRPWH